MPNHLNIRPLEKDDLAFADAVRALAGWNQTAADWRRFLLHEPEGCVLCEWEGSPAGVVTTIRYGKELAWIGMMLVHPQYRRRGIASALMDTAIEFLRSKNVTCIKLDATPEGAKVYEQLGFRPELELFRWEGDLKAKQKHSLKEPLLLPIEIDCRAFGVDRSAWLELLARDAEDVRLLRDAAGRLVAFGMLRKGSRANYLGPISAESRVAGRKLVDSLLGQVSGLTYWDILEENREAVAMAELHGFRRSRPLLRMWLGDKLVKGEIDFQFGIGDPSTG